MASNDTAQEDTAEERTDFRGAVIGRTVGYVEDPNHVPPVGFVYGTVDTSDTADEITNQMDVVSPVFALSRANAAIAAARALDAEDLSVAQRSVILPQTAQRTLDDVRQEIHANARRAVDNPVEIGGPNKFAAAAARGADDEATESAAAAAEDEQAAATEGQVETSEPQHETQQD